MDRMAILAKTQKRHEGKSERGGGCNNPPSLLKRGLKVTPCNIRKSCVLYTQICNVKY